jgi:uncharacterized protein (DUF2141 family)
MRCQVRILTKLLGWMLVVSGAMQNTRAQAPPSPDVSRPAQTFKIAGTVVNAMTGAPLSQARISIAGVQDRSKPAFLITTEDGHFEFSSLKPGKYSLAGAKRGFISAAYEQHEQFSTAIVAGPEFSTENLVLRLTPMALITGHVMDEFGDPVREANLTLYFESHGGGMTRIAHYSNSQTDDRGFYDFSQLRPGKYYVSVTAKPWYAIHPSTAPVPANAPVRPSQVSSALDVAYPTIFYNGATDADGATAIEVRGGDRLEIDVHMNPVPALHLFFRMPTDGRGQSSGFQMPTLEKRVFDSVDFVQSEGSNGVNPGVIELTGVPPGHYTVRTKNSDTGQLQQSADVDLTRDGQELNESRGEPLGGLKVTIKMPGDEPLPVQYVVGLQNARRQTVGYQQGDPTGKFSFSDLPPGKYTILIFSQAKPFAVMRTTSPAGDSWGHDATVAAGATAEVTASISAGIVNIEGVVQKKDKKVAGVMVALVPSDPVAHIDLFRRDQSDFDGTFALQGVIPGAYTIVAIEDAWGLDWLQPNALARYVQHGQSISIGDFMTGTLHLPNPIEVQPH